MSRPNLKRLRPAAAAAVAVIGLAASWSALAQPGPGLREQLRACVAEKRAAYFAPRPFESPELSLTCPGADLVGFPPRESRHERNEFVTFQASEGYRIVPGSAAVCGTAAGAAVSPVTVSPDGLMAQAPLSCRGGGLGAAPITVSTRICGEERRAENDGIERGWLADCARALSEARR